MIEIESEGAWPEYSLKDINNARIELMRLGHFDLAHEPLESHVSSVIWHGLDCMFHKTPITYKTFFRDNNLSTIIEDKEVEEGTALVRFEDDVVQINNIKLDFEKNCDFCPNTFRIHHEAVKLEDGRLVCDVCYAQVFDTVLS